MEMGEGLKALSLWMDAQGPRRPYKEWSLLGESSGF
jgi:hypothetical protein